MFSLKFMVDDKSLAQVLRALGEKGRLYNLEVVPVTNAEIAGTRVVEKNSGTRRAQLLGALPPKFTTKEAAKILAELGGKKESIYNCLAAFVEAKAIKRNASGEYYRIEPK